MQLRCSWLPLACLPAFPLALAIGMAAACFSPPLNDCAIGSEGCACTGGDGCDVGLECANGICVSADATGETIAAGDGDGDGDSGDGDGDGDGDPGDGDPGDGDGDPGCPPGQLGCPCDGDMCDDGLVCVEGECSLGGDGDGDGDGDGESCEPRDQYCVANGCPNMELVIDEDQNGQRDWGWCLYACLSETDTSDCPMALNGASVECIDWSGAGDYACYIPCNVDESDPCPPGGSCYDGAGVGICVYDVTGL